MDNMWKVSRVIFIFAVSASFYLVDGEEAKCICSGSDDAYITTVSGKTICSDENSNAKIQTQILERLDSMLQTMKEEAALLRALAGKQSSNLLDFGSENVLLNTQTLNSTLYNKYHFPSSCAEATAISRKSGTYSIQLDAVGPKPFKVSCNEDLHEGGWTVVLRRMDGSVDFFRKWPDYKQGFGNLEGEFFIGLDKLFALTNSQYAQELIFVMEDFDNARKYAKYSSFAIGDESERYVLKVLGDYSGDAGDSLRTHAGQTFKTKEIEDKPHNCATQYTGAWWYNACHASNLCGTYLKGAYGQEKFAQGVVWHSWRGHNYSLKSALMMIRPKRS